MTTEHANVIIYLLIFLCVLAIIILFRVTEVSWYLRGNIAFKGKHKKALPGETVPLTAIENKQ